MQSPLPAKARASPKKSPTLKKASPKKSPEMEGYQKRGRSKTPLKGFTEYVKEKYTDFKEKYSGKKAVTLKSMLEKEFRKLAEDEKELWRAKSRVVEKKPIKG